MTEIARDHKQILFIRQISTEHLTVRRLTCTVRRTDQHRHHFELCTLHHFGDKRQMQFNTMFILVGLEAHLVEQSGLMQFSVGSFIDLQIVQWCLIEVGRCERTAAQWHMMRWAEYENSFSKLKKKMERIRNEFKSEIYMLIIRLIITL